MGLEAVQSALAQLYTDRALREDFFTNPALAGREMGLNDEEISQLAQLSEQQVNLFASSLQYKRLGEVRKLLPLTQNVLGKRFGRLFLDYADAYIPQGTKKHWHDAIAFCEFLSVKSLGDWVCTVVRYEKSCLEMFEPQRRLLIRFFPYPLQFLNARSFQDLPKGNREIELVFPQQPTICLWFRQSQKAPLKQYCFTLPF
ncbi:hypothetical protein IQ249_16610 [Lusitaniella coriacea LEGE 07157]|uniref:SCO6045-like C-terminal domain-containing protein n=1 Tax=Lusitaniella coriacea LEGE 07157 TaxID=945747 RepID=A0A8J7DYD7_9CYAN|nr:hypothetical protein [Lusitaniella coriacea]MBE9117522.1 hypothetical protein [Lusitaniella coriacea LEGE 07157]